MPVQFRIRLALAIRLNPHSSSRHNTSQHGQRIRGPTDDLKQIAAAPDQASKVLAKRDVPAHQVAQAGDAVAAQHEPDLQRPEAPAERDLPVAVVGDEAGDGRRVDEVGRRYRQGAGQGGAGADEKAAGG